MAKFSVLDYIDASNFPVLFSTKQSIVVMFGIMAGSKILHLILSYALLKKYDNTQASYRSGGLSGKSALSKDDEWKGKLIQRSYNAHLNHIEAFIGLSAAILMSLTSSLSVAATSEIHQLANAFIIIRIIYNIVYIFAANEALSYIRSSVFLYGFLMNLKIFVLSTAP